MRNKPSVTAPADAFRTIARANQTSYRIVK